MTSPDDWNLLRRAAARRLPPGFAAATAARARAEARHAARVRAALATAAFLTLAVAGWSALETARDAARWHEYARAWDRIGAELL